MEIINAYKFSHHAKKKNETPKNLHDNQDTILP